MPGANRSVDQLLAELRYTVTGVRGKIGRLLCTLHGASDLFEDPDRTMRLCFARARARAQIDRPKYVLGESALEARNRKERKATGTRATVRGAMIYRAE